jgi:hypothetical protein
MDEQVNTADKIMTWLKEQVETRADMAPRIWLIAAARLNAVLIDLQQERIMAEMKVAELVAERITAGETSTKAHAMVRATPFYSAAKYLKAKEDRAEKMIQIAKVIQRTPDI